MPNKNSRFTNVSYYKSVNICITDHNTLYITNTFKQNIKLLKAVCNWIRIYHYQYTCKSAHTSNMQPPQTKNQNTKTYFKEGKLFFNAVWRKPTVMIWLLLQFFNIYVNIIRWPAKTFTYWQPPYPTIELIQHTIWKTIPSKDWWLFKWYI